MGIKNPARSDKGIYPEGCGLVQSATTCAAKKLNLCNKTIHRCLDIVGVDDCNEPVIAVKRTRNTMIK